MTVTLYLNSELEAGLLAKAQARGMDVEHYLQALVEQEAAQPLQKNAAPDRSRREEAVRRMLEFGEKYRLSLGGPVTRELLHEGHRF